jgi:hypothetical protein
MHLTFCEAIKETNTTSTLCSTEAVLSFIPQGHVTLHKATGSSIFAYICFMVFPIFGMPRPVVHLSP